MAKKKCAPCPPTGAPDWMVTYGDLMTLLLCFFVLLFSFSEMDKLQFESMKDSFTGAFGVMDGHVSHIVFLHCGTLASPF